jgi:uncharacterized OB-fold protein
MAEEGVELVLSNGDRIIGWARGRVDHPGDPNEGDEVRVKWDGYAVPTYVKRSTLDFLPVKAPTLKRGTL